MSKRQGQKGQVRACFTPARWSVSDLAAGNVDEQQQQQEKQDKGTERTGEFFSLVRYPASDLAAEDVNHHQQEH